METTQLLVYLHTTPPYLHGHPEVCLRGDRKKCSDCDREIKETVHFLKDDVFCSTFCRWKTAKEMSEVLR